MKKSFLLLSAFILLNIFANGQSLGPTALVSTGGYFTGGGNSLSWTLGETFTTTLQNGNVVLTQGEQQPYVELTILNIKAFIEGYYLGAGLMRPCLYNNEQAGTIPGLPFPQGPYTTADCDYVVISAMDASTGNLVASQTGLIKTDGTVSVKFRSPVVNGTSYWIRITHRNVLEIWSVAPVNFAATTSLSPYDFTTNFTQAYSVDGYTTLPMRQMTDGSWAFLSGDMGSLTGEGIQDGNIDTYDFNYWDARNAVFDYGYFVGDLNGDVNVDSYDFNYWDLNNAEFKYVQRPF